MTTASARPRPSSASSRGSAGQADAEIRLIPSADLARHLPAIADVGGRCFTRPPWREPYPMARSVAARVLADSERPGFVLALALSGDEVYGFAYGLRCSALALSASHPPRNDFTFKELAVLPELCGMKLGLALHDTVLAAVPNGPYWLSTHPAAHAAIGLYRHRGWRAVAIQGPRRVIMHKR
ncbi:GNAT family N-acetyltransferase [Thermopolyspora sp. NPDC052614]|uniref:GNAT family N-acetyltransferase n=1 Tax=Thermopolyspora sp. NPDC052614 TaxID=3155682 RepID=UPI0034219886